MKKKLIMQVIKKIHNLGLLQARLNLNYLIISIILSYILIRNNHKMNDTSDKYNFHKT